MWAMGEDVDLQAARTGLPLGPRALVALAAENGDLDRQDLGR